MMNLRAVKTFAAVALVAAALSGQSVRMPTHTLSSPAPGATTVGFAPSGTYSSIYGPYIVADVNGDGKLDLVRQDSGVAVLLGNGDGTFQPEIVSGCCRTNFVALGDFNNDGKLDAVIGENSQGFVSIMQGNGQGEFSPGGSFATDNNPFAGVVGDFNGDGKLDIAVLCSGNGTYPDLNVLFGNGDGTLQATTAYALGGYAYSLATADLNGDGHLDLVIPTSTGMAVLMGNADGTFRKPAIIPGQYNQIAIADLNNDGTPDLVATGRQINVLLGKGDGTFHKAVGYAVQSPNSITVGDFNGDGILDLAVADAGTYNQQTHVYNGGFSFLLGNGDGTFQPPIEIGSFQDGQYIAAGDFNGDGRSDLAVQNYNQFESNFLATYLESPIAISSGLITFPPTIVGKTSAAKIVTVTNAGNSAATISQVTLGGANVSNFAISNDGCTGVTISPAGNCAVSLTFSPPATGASYGTLTFSDNAAHPQIVALTGGGTYLEMSPAGLDFGAVKVGGRSKLKVIIVTNTSSQKVAIHGISINGHDSGDFYEFNTCEGAVKPKSSCSVSVQFIPTKTGARKARAGVATANTASAPKPVSLTGTGN